MSLRLKLTAWGLCLMSLAAVACSGGAPPGASDANLAKAKKMNAPGNDVFQKECAGCHGSRGEGVNPNPKIMGPGALPLYKRDPTDSTNPAMQQQAQYRTNEQTMGSDPRGEFKTAQNLFDYVSKQMPLPKSKAGTLTPEQYWAVVNFMLVSHGVNVPEGGVNASNAASIEVQPPP
jgi:mono/diheme cytochrome c family protein